jgi:hypothetical protein
MIRAAGFEVNPSVTQAAVILCKAEARDELYRAARVNSAA